MDSPNPYQPSQQSNPFADSPAQSGPLDQRAIEEAARQMVREQQDRTTSWQLLATGVIGCMSPILAIYGVIFLLRRPYSFPLKGLAIAGTVLHCLWTLLLVGMVALGALAGRA